MSIYERSHTEKFEVPTLNCLNDQLEHKKLKNGIEFAFRPDSSQFDEEDWLKDWKDYTNKEKLDDAAQILRKEIMRLRPVFSSRPPPEKEIDSERMIIPKALEYILEILLYATEKKTLRRERLTKSLAQDHIYNCSIGTKKTIKHVELGLCAKRKTGSRKFNTWLNHLGHCISYHQVNLVEIGIAEEQINNFSTAAFVPSAIRVSEFVTFVYDNGDIYVESIYNKSYYCTNAIAIQRRQYPVLSDSTERPPVIQKK